MQVNWVIRNYEGQPFIWGSATLGVIASPLEAEAKALLLAMQQTWSRGFTSLIFEGYCKILIDSLAKKSVDIRIENLCHDISAWKNRFSFCNIIHTKRTNNVVAHTIAKKGPPNGTFFFFNDVPSSFRAVDKDNIMASRVFVRMKGLNKIKKTGPAFQTTFVRNISSLFGKPSHYKYEAQQLRFMR